MLLLLLRWCEPSAPAARYAGLDFAEDPFKDSNYRYGDPFDLDNTKDDPFNQPFKAPQTDSSDAFSKADPFTSLSGADPFSDSKSDPFGSAFGGESSYENSRDPFPRPSGDPFSQSESDPFSPGKAAPARDAADPFGSSFTASFPSAVPTVDPFSSNNNFGNDPFSLTNLPTPTSDINANSTVKVDRVAPTNNTVSYRKEKTSIDTSESAPSKSSLKKKTSHSLSDFLTGSPMKAGDKGDKVKEKKEKKHGKFHISSPLKAHKAKSVESPKSASRGTAGDNGVDEVGAT